MRSWLKRLDQYWFGHGSPTALGLFRMVMSGLILVNLAMILTDFETWFGEKGFVPMRTALAYQSPLPVSGRFFLWRFDLPFSVPRLNLLAGVVDDRITLAFYLATMVAALLTAFGLWTRLSSIAMALGVVTLQHRNGLILHGGDSVMRLGALYIALAPSGAACSLDRLIGLWKGRIAPGPVRVSLWVQRLIIYNTALIYFTTFWHKFGFGSHWRDMTATWYPARLNEFVRFPVPGFLNDIPFVYFSTFFTLAVELAMGTLVFYRPLRKWVLLAAVGLHAYIDYSMNIPLFSFLMVSLYICFYEGTEIDAWARAVGQRLQRFSTIVFTPLAMRLKPGAAAVLAAVDPFRLIAYEEGDAPSWKSMGGHPFRESLARSIGAWPTACVPYLWRRLLNRSLETAGPDATRVRADTHKAKSKR